MADINISYKGNTISELNESGSKTLKTSGKYCEDDITVEYAGVSKKKRTLGRRKFYRL